MKYDILLLFLLLIIYYNNNVISYHYHLSNHRNVYDIRQVNSKIILKQSIYNNDDINNRNNSNILKNYNPFKKPYQYLNTLVDNDNDNVVDNNEIIKETNDFLYKKENLIIVNEPIVTHSTTPTTTTTNNNNNSINKFSEQLKILKLQVNKLSNRLVTQWIASVQDMKKNPSTYLLIPVCAALIGYITNWVGVNMLFYPMNFWGIPIFKIEGQPLGFIGWQGIVPAKRIAMASRIVDITISKLISIPEVFSQLKPNDLAKLLSPTIKESLPMTSLPGISTILHLLLKQTSKSIIKNIENILDIKTLVVSGLTTDTNVLVNLFQKVGHTELKFLINSGMGFGFILGIFQMIQWMFLPYNWTLPVGGAIVGYITNWIALKWIFEPLNPTKIGPFLFQGLFLRRQNEVSKDFSEYICSMVLTSPKVWQSMLEGPKSNSFVDIIKKYTKIPFLSNTVMAKLITDVGGSVTHPIHDYTERQLNLKNILMSKMNQMSSAEFEQVLHPIFQEDELTLIIAGGILGALSGLLQWYFNVKGMDMLNSWWQKIASKKESKKNYSPYKKQYHKK